MKSNQENPIVLRVKILDYLLDDLHFDYDDGSFEWFDATKVEILEPKEFSHKLFYIYHNIPAEAESMWRNIGLELIIEFVSRKSIFNPDKHDEIIYSDGVKINE